jgi:hypothetical protein
VLDIVATPTGFEPVTHSLEGTGSTTATSWRAMAGVEGLGAVRVPRRLPLLDCLRFRVDLACDIERGGRRQHGCPKRGVRPLQIVNRARPPAGPSELRTRL